MNWHDLSYLQRGSPRQQQAYRYLTGSRLFEQLGAYDPVLVGTVPLRIDTVQSDLDVLCYLRDESAFMAQLASAFSGKNGFELYRKPLGGIPSVIARFQEAGEKIEIVGQPVPVREQRAYRHMVVEHEILQEKGEAFRREVIRLKEMGVKTEPAFARLLGLDGDPYEQLLRFPGD
jgi:hypothetical protein